MEIQWSLVLFTALAGAGGWALACAAADEVRGRIKGDNGAFTAVIVAIIVCIVGGLASVTHLSHPDRMLAALGHPTSGIFTEAVLLGLTVVCAIVYLIVLKKAASATLRKVFLVLAAVFGVVLAFASGASYMMSSQLTWDTALLPIAYGFTCAPAGVGLYLAVTHATQADNMKFVGGALCASGVLAAVTSLAYGLSTGAASSSPAIFWGLAVVVGGVVPAICGAIATKKPDSVLGTAIVAIAAGLIGSIALRCIMWTAAVFVNNFFGQI